MLRNLEVCLKLIIEFKGQIFKIQLQGVDLLHNLTSAFSVLSFCQYNSNLICILHISLFNRLEFAHLSCKLLQAAVDLKIPCKCKIDTFCWMFSSETRGGPIRQKGFANRNVMTYGLGKSFQKDTSNFWYSQFLRVLIVRCWIKWLGDAELKKKNVEKSKMRVCFENTNLWELNDPMSWAALVVLFTDSWRILASMKETIHF